MTDLDEYNAMMAAGMTEKRFQDIVVAHAKREGWLVYHTHDSRRSEPGYPDLHLVHVGQKRSVFRELKTQKGRTSPDQIKWLNALLDLGIDAGVWRPADWFNSTIQRELDPNYGTDLLGHNRFTGTATITTHPEGNTRS